MIKPRIGWTVAACCISMMVGVNVRAQVSPTDTDTGIDTGNAPNALPTRDSAPPEKATENPVQSNVPISKEQREGSAAGEAPAPKPAASSDVNNAAGTAAQSPAPSSAKTEIVPEAVVVDTTGRPGPHVGIELSDAKHAMVSDGNRKILVGTWTKSIQFSTDDGSFKFQPRGWIQPRFTLSVYSDQDRNGGEPFDGTGFSLQRARFGFQAWLFKWGHFYLDSEWKTGSGQLVDYFVDLGPNNGEYPVGVRVGYFRPFLSRQLLHATTQLAMIDYAKAWTALDMVSSADADQPGGFSYKPTALMGRQLGIAVQGLVANGFEYGVGIWNGSDGYAVDADFMYGGRIAVHPMGFSGGPVLRPGDESDTEISTRPGFVLGLAAYVEDRNDATADLPGLLPYEDFKLRAGVDAAFKYAGVSLEAEFFLVNDWAKQEITNDYLKLHHRDAPGMGTYFQVGYMVVPKRFEVVGRFDMADENIQIRGIRFYPTVGITYFLFGNNLKAQFQYRANFGTAYDKDADAMYTPVTHDVIFLLQASI